MNQKLKAALIILISIMLSHCKSKEKDSSIPTFIFDEVTQSIDLRLTDIITDIQLIALETADEALIGNDAQLLLTKNNIIVITKDKILQFNRDGKFIRCLANSGRGPEEFSYLTHCEIDRNERSFHYLQWPNNKIYRIDLASGKHQSPILFPENMQAETFAIIDENRIAVFPHIHIKTDYLVFYQDSLGNIFEGIESKREGSESSLYTTLHSAKIGSRLFYLHSEISRDTTFIIDGLKKEPYFIIQEKERFEATEEITDGYLTIPIPISSTFWLFQNQMITKNMNNYKIKLKFYLALGKEFNLYQINSFTNDLTGAVYNSTNIVSVFFRDAFYNDLESNRAAFLIESHKLLNMLESEMFKELSPSNQGLLTSIDGKITEDDNPILIIGKIRNDAKKSITSRQE